jgi:hypothetical protein
MIEATEPDWKEGDILECKNEQYHFKVLFHCFTHIDRAAFGGTVVESMKGSHEVGLRTRWRSRGFTKCEAVANG